ncbi:MAG: pantoate--beta-alanine ligase [Ignavibacteria bacterium]|nr:pantoate--beta-alanine ligase [Ignavibacteria bacterium]
MKVITSMLEMQQYSNKLRSEGKSIGFVPTMGYLHEGHISLLRASKNECVVSVVSIFVNPTQFSPNEDLAKYPRDFERDFSLLEKEDCDILFYPEPSEIYPPNYQTYVVVDGITNVLEGQYRPTHFRGVTTIVNLLFNIVLPHKAYFGQKDAQQCAVILKMVNDLRMNLEVRICPIIRESDGLAMSSRNIYLSDAERIDALVLSRAIITANELIISGERNVAEILNAMVAIINRAKSSSLDYIEIVDFFTFEKVEKLFKGKKYLILIACKIGKTRLIDNDIITINS